MPVANRHDRQHGPEYGATAGFFPVDEETTRYLRLTGRDETGRSRRAVLPPPGNVATTRVTSSTHRCWKLDMSSVVPSLAGPRRPQDRIDLGDMKTAWQHEMATGFAGKGATKGTVVSEGESFDLGNGDVVIPPSPRAPTPRTPSRWWAPVW